LLRMAALLSIVLCSSAFGMIVAKRYSLRPKQLRDFHQAVAALETEISYGATPLPQALRIAVAGVDQPVSGFFLQVAEKVFKGKPAGLAWERTCEELAMAFCFTSGDWKIINSIGVGLGTTDRIEEKKKLKLSCSRLLAQEEDATEKSLKIGRVWRYMGFLAGSALALVIW